MPRSFNVLDQSLLEIEETTSELRGQCAAFCLDSRQQLNEMIVSNLYSKISLKYILIIEKKNINFYNRHLIFQDEQQEQRELLDSLRHEYELQSQSIDTMNPLPDIDEILQPR